MSEEILKACPYCSSCGMVYYDNIVGYWAKCLNSTCSVSTTYKQSVPDVIKEWNGLENDPLQNPKTLCSW